MTEPYDLVLTEAVHAELVRHLFPSDGCEAAAILFCRDASPARRRLMVIDALPVPHAECPVRTPVRLTWPGERLAEAVDRAEDEGLTLILLHSHPGGWLSFSAMDDDSDAEAVTAVHRGWAGAPVSAGHGSAVITPDGRITARLYDADGAVRPIGVVAVVGETLRFERDAGDSRAAMAFGSEMTAALGGLHACVVGVSGTGSIIAEQAARMGFGTLTLIDFDRIEPKNLNRILNSTAEDAAEGRLKVGMTAAALKRIRPELEVHEVSATVASREGVLAAARADVIFSCVDSHEGRHILDRLAQAFMIPLIDMGVTIPTRGDVEGRTHVAEVLGRIDYVWPGSSTLADRGVYSGASLRAEYLQQAAPETFAEEVDAGYIRGAPQEAPSVIALNMRAASQAMLEFIARAFSFRHHGEAGFAQAVFRLAEGEEERSADDAFARSGAYPVGTGAAEPLLGLPALGE